SLAVAAGGVEPKLAGSLLADSSGAISVAAPRIPPVLQALTAEPGASSAFDVAGMAKDLSLMARYAAESGFALPVAEAARQSYEAAAADGWRAKDAPMLAAWQCRRSRRG
ncbi:MAG TPA: NAD-binding protein, partial [Alphaproteobacteria bacterium]|nr:NAD-binding protein [Alphaproteobacteria bacterium]